MLVAPGRPPDDGDVLAEQHLGLVRLAGGRGFLRDGEGGVGVKDALIDLPFDRVGGFEGGVDAGGALVLAVLVADLPAELGMP